MTEARKRCTSAHKFTMSATTQLGGYEILSVKVTLYYYPFFFFVLSSQKGKKKRKETYTHVQYGILYTEGPLAHLYRCTACNSAGFLCCLPWSHHHRRWAIYISLVPSCCSPFVGWRNAEEHKRNPL